MPEVIIPTTVFPPPKHHEVSAAFLIAGYFKRDVIFIERSLIKSADFIIGTDEWELKSPSGNGKRTIQRTLQSAMKQASNIIVDARGAHMNQSKMKRELQFEFSRRTKIKRLVFISKSGIIVEFMK